MPKFLILRLDGPMQAWGTHTFEDFRPSNLYPTRSGLLGLLGACLGIERSDLVGQTQLAASVEFTVRVDSQIPRPGVDGPVAKPGIKLADFHTVMDARKVDGSANKFPMCRAVNTCSTRLLQWPLAAGPMRQSALTVSLTHYAARFTLRRWAAVPVR